MMIITTFNFYRLFQTEGVCRFADNFEFDENGRKFLNRWKTLWEKEKLLVTSNFSFSHSVFKRLVQHRRKKPWLVWLIENVGKEMNLPHSEP